MIVVKMKLADLRRPERNVRMHTDKQLREFKRSVAMFGQIRPIVIDEQNMILAGNGLYDTLCAMGKTEADCYIVEGLSEAEKKKLMLADNRIFSLGVDDMAVFDAFVKELQDDLDIPGFDDDLLQSLVAGMGDVGDTLREYGMIDQDQMQSIRDAGERSDAMLQREQTAPSNPTPPITPAAHNASHFTEPIHGASGVQERPSIVCPKCGECIWL